MRKIIIFVLFTFVHLSGQEITGWQNFSNMENVIDIAVTDNLVWAATNGGVFSYSVSDSSFKTLTKSEGLSSQNITSIAVDKNNNVWIGSVEGFINIYYPQTNKIKTILEINKFNNTLKSINDITIKNDTAFISTDFGLSLININNLSFFDSILKFGSLPSKTPVKNIYLGSTIYVLTNAGIVYKKRNAQNFTAPETWEIINLGQQLSPNAINKLVEYQNKLFAAANSGLYEVSDNNINLVHYANLKVVDLTINNSLLFSLLENSVHKFNGASDETVLEFPSLKLKSFNVNDNGDFTIATNKGIIYQNNYTQLPVSPNAPQTNAAISLTVDKEGNLWSATGKDNNGIGVLKYNGVDWFAYNVTNVPEFKSNDFYKVSSSDNYVYFSNWGNGFVRYNNDKYEAFDAGNTDMVGIPENVNFLVIDDIKEDDKGNAWILNFWAANKKPLSVLTHDGKWYHYQFANSILPRVVFANNLVVDQFSTKWFAVTGLGTEGLYYFNENGTLDNPNDDTWGRLTKYNGLRNNTVRALAIDKFGELIIGTSLGVDVISNPSDISSLSNLQYFSIREQTINCIAVDPINQKWFGTTKGVFLTSSDGSLLLASYNQSNSPLPSDDIKSIAIDENTGTVYVGTSLGVTAIKTLFIKPNKNFNELFVYPNPVTIDNNSNLNIIIDGLVENSRIKILDISGKLITEFNSIGGKTTYWNLRDKDNNLIPSGIYIIVAYDSEVNKLSHTKLAVIRK